MVESLTYKYINGNLAQEYAANWKVESQNLPLGSTLETSEVPSQLTITVPANNTSSTRRGKIVLLQPASGKRITINYSQPTSIQNNGIIIYVYSDPSTQDKGVIQVPQNTWADNGGDTAIYTLYLKGSEIKAGSTFYFQCRFYAINGWEGLLIDPEYNKALNYKIDTVQPSWNPSGTILFIRVIYLHLISQEVYL